MEEKLREHIGLLRAKFNKQGLDVDKLVAILKRDQLLPPERVIVIEQQTTSAAKLDRLLDEIVNAKDSVYHKLLKAVEQCVPPAVSPVFLSLPRDSHRYNPTPSTESCSASLTSDSEDDAIRVRALGLPDGQVKEVQGGNGKLTSIIYPRPHDHSATSTIPSFSDRCSPLPLVDERHSPFELSRKQLSIENRLDWVHIKRQFDGALGELETLKQQNAEKISQLSVEAEYFRNLYKRSESAVQQAQEELSVLRSVKALNVELITSKQNLMEELEQLKRLREEEQEEMNELRLQHHKAVASHSGSGDSEVNMTELYHSSLQKFEMLSKDYEVIRQRYADLLAQHSSVCCQLEACGDLQKQLEETRRERDSILRDKIAFQQHSTTVLQNLEQMIQENGKLKATMDNLQREHDSATKDQRKVHLKTAQLQKDFSQAMAERDAAVMEYRQVMSEREVVHKEIEQLQDKYTETKASLGQCLKEKAAAEKEMERLKKENQGFLESRSQLEEEHGELQRELHLVEQQRDIARKERHQALEQMDLIIKDTYEKTQKEKAEESKETELLKKQIDKIKMELSDAEQEAMVATKRRDWAFSEIDKTVQERESIRTLCDNMRRYRDRAVSDLAKALRNCDECEKQKNDAIKELNEIREKYEALAEREARRQHLNSVGHNYSRDSAIDADLQEWETETLEMELGEGSCDVGFSVAGGKDSPLFPGDSTVYVSHVAKGGAAEGRLRVNDQLLKVNNLDLTNLDLGQVQQALHSHHGGLVLVVRRRKLSMSRIWQPLQISLSCQEEDSVQLEQGLFISRIHPGRIIAMGGMLPSCGDRLISINRQSTESLSVQEAASLLETSAQPLVLGVFRHAPSLSSTGSSPTPTSVLPPSAEHPSLMQSAGVSKSDTLDIHNSARNRRFGDGAFSDNSNNSSSKNLRCSGSQTDSFESPVPSPRKSLRSNAHDKVRHSMPVLDIVVDKIFRSRNKSAERAFSAERHCSGDDVWCDESPGHGVDKMVRPMSAMATVATQTPPPIVAPEAQTVKHPSRPFDPGRADTRFAPYKRDHEADSNNGTWPKSRTSVVITSTVPSTVTLAPSKERPSIMNDPSFFQPPPQQYTTGADTRDQHAADRLDPCHSEAGGVKSPSRVVSPQPMIPSCRAPPSFSVRMTQGPSLAVVRPTIPRPWPRPGPPNYQQSSQHSRHPQDAPSLPCHSPHVWRPPPPHPHAQYYPPHPRQPVPRNSNCRSYPGSPPPQQIIPKAGPNHNPYSEKSPPGLPMSGRPSHPPPYSPTSLSHEDGVRGRAVPSEGRYSVEFSDLSGEESRPASSMGSPVGVGMPPHLPPSSPQHLYAATSSFTNQHSGRVVMMNPRYSSPPVMCAAVSPEPEIERALFHPFMPGHTSPCPSQQSFMGVDRITPTPSEEFGVGRYSRPPSHSPLGPPVSEMDFHHMTAGGQTRQDRRIRIPSGGTRSGSVEIVSDRSSPVSSVIRSDGTDSHRGKRFSLSSSADDYFYSPRHHKTRTIIFEKSSEPVGFQIQRGPAGGIFVSVVNDNSLASEAGLEIGDQLLEVCGINMRNATHEHAVTVLRQCGENLSMKVQYNPEKYMDDDSASTISIMSPMNPSPSPTHSKLSSGDSSQSTPKHHTPQHSHSNSSADGTYERPHVVHFKRNKGESGPGFTVVGGNAVGIFVHEIQSDSSAASVLQRGDMILEYNDVSFQSLTAEEANLELNKHCSVMRMTVLNSIPKYSRIQTIPGDHFFVRANFSREGEGDGELGFAKDSILMVEDTMHRATLGLWRAWLLDHHGNKLRCGSIPSRFRLEDEVVLRRSHSENLSLGGSEEGKGSWRGLGSARRSFFRRRRHHRNSSKDSQEGSFAEASLNSESVPILDESIFGYTQVEKIECQQTRPVVLLAPLADPLIRKLASASPDKYKFCEPRIASGVLKDLKQGLAQGHLVDFWMKEDHFECIQASSIRDIANKGIHCLLNVNPQAVERLHRLKIYPIVIFIQHKNHKQIKEIRDTQFMPEKVSGKAAKEMFDHYSRLDHDFGHLFSVVVQGGNLAEMSMRIKAAINTESKKPVWVPVC
ncbi:disks large homolog 5-like isoform X2 [Babylonia areolata]|uniref:disks large homolog 5-like isoform X2 n=1 Tax=Babylonia areolata TaxID=304850 RepID=UPI003FCFB6A4